MNDNWLKSTRPILEAFWHTKYFTRMMITLKRERPCPQIGFGNWFYGFWIRFAPLTVLFGANSSGKSSVAQFLLMLKAKNRVARQEDGLQYQKLQNRQRSKMRGCFPPNADRRIRRPFAFSQPHQARSAPPARARRGPLGVSSAPAPDR
jgi:hypothetical protein